jgi:hypothetical protein
MFSEINSLFFGRSIPNSPTDPVKSEEDWKKCEAEIYGSSYKISEKVFAHRMVPVYLDKTAIVGINSYESALHWIEILSSWIEGKGLFLTLPISKEHLISLRDHLKSYAETLALYNRTPSSDARKAAKTTLQNIQSHLLRKKTYYTPLGYAGGVSSGGHAIPLKLCNEREYVEASFLNLGEGVQIHPQVGQDSSGVLFHFQSFPALIQKETLASKKGEDVFTRLIKIKTQSPSPQVAIYSAEDVYFPIYSLGEVQSSFPSSVALRARKSQLGNICGDMAILLIVKDFLIDQRYSKAAIHRLITLEKFTNILLFFDRLKGYSAPADEWVLLKNGIKEFSIRVLKSAKEALKEQEIERFHSHIKPIFTTTCEQIQTLKKRSLTDFRVDIKCRSELSLEVTMVNGKPPITTKKIKIKTPAQKRQADPNFIGEIPPLTPQNICAILSSLAEKICALWESDQEKEAHETAYKFMCSLEIPHFEKKDFWDEVAEVDISKIIQSLSLLARHGIDVKASAKHKLVYRNVLLFSIGYAITDKLVRRKYGHYLKDFAAPFFPAQFDLSYHSSKIASHFDHTSFTPKKEFFDFALLPLAPANIRWNQIRTYFEGRLKLSKHTLFCPPVDQEEVPNLQEALRHYQDSRSVYETWTPILNHLKFLEQFLEKSFPPDCNLSLYDKFRALSENADDQYIPAEIAILQFFAFYAQFLCDTLPTRRPPPRVECETSRAALGPKKFPDANQSNLGLTGSRIGRLARALTENEIQCLQEREGQEIAFTQEDQAWYRIFSIPALQITSLIFWMRNNISLLGRPEIQVRVQLALFAPGVLADKIASEPTILEQLREVIHIALKAHGQSKSNSDTTLFLIRIGVALETYAPLPSSETLAFYEKCLLERLDSSDSSVSPIYDHLLFLYQSALPRGEHSLSELIKAQFWLAYNNKGGVIPAWLKAETLAPFKQYQGVAMALFKNREWKEKLVADLLTLLFKQEFAIKAPCTGKYPIIEQGEWRIDIESKQVFRDGSHRLVFMKWQALYELSLPISHSLFWEINGALISHVGHHKIELNQEGDCVIAKQFPQFCKTPLEGVWFVKGSAERTHFPTSLLGDNDYFDHWISDRGIVICRKGQSVPRYLAIEGKEGFLVFKIRENGQLGAQLLNLQSQEKMIQSILPWFERLGNKAEVCVWVDPTTGMIEELEYLLLKLTFQQKEGRFYCQNYPGFYLTDEQAIEELNFFKGGVVMQQGAEKMVILPFRQLERSNHNFSTEVSFKADFIDLSMADTKVFTFLYRIDEMAGLLIHPEPNANLFLVFLFAMQRDYAKALLYLQRSRAFYPFSKESQWAFKALYNLQDHSPEALAFYLRLGLFIKKNARQILEAIYGNRTSLENNFFKWLGKKYEMYFRYHALNGVSRIPSSMRLTPEEHIFMLEIMKNTLTQCDKDVAKSLIISNDKLLPPRPFGRKVLRCSSIY